MARARKGAHVHAHLRNDHFRGAPIDPRDAIQASQLFRKRGEGALNFRAEGADRFVQIVQMRQELANEEGMMRPKAAGQCRAEGGQLAAQPAPREVGQERGIGGPVGERVQHGAPRDAENVAGDRRQLDPRILQGLVQPVGDARAILNEGFAVARQVAVTPCAASQSRRTPTGGASLVTTLLAVL